MPINVHDIAKSGFGEGTNDAYDKARPSYPASALHKIYASLPPPSNTSKGGLTILEPGSGTGIFTRLLLQPPDSTYPSFPISKLTAIEPSSGMRAAWQRGLEGKVDKRFLEGKKVWTVEGSFDDFSGVKGEIGEGEVDVVVIAQAWHWCPDHESALREISKYLSPQGIFILIWNLESDSPLYQRAIRDLYEPLDLGTPQYYKGLWRRCFDSIAYKELFEPPEESSSVWSLGITEDQLVERLFSKSYLTEAHLNGEKRSEFERDLRKIIREGDKEWVDKEHGVFLYNYNTDVVVIRRKQS